jgi:hypothetical protein
MKFTTDRITLIKMLEQVGPAVGQRTTASSLVRVMACEARVFVIANGITAAIEALVLRDGSCMLDRRRFLAVLKTYASKQQMTFDLEDRVLRFGSTEIGVPVSNRTAKAPEKFRTFPFDDSWIAASKSTSKRSLQW